MLKHYVNVMCGIYVPHCVMDSVTLWHILMTNISYVIYGINTTMCDIFATHILH